jgi:large subunit ribosomal protein L22
MEVRAIAKSVRMSPRKAKLVIDLIRGKKVGQAIAILNNVESTVKEPISKVLNSAIANAVNNNSLEADKLYIKEIYANPGQILKRMRPRAKGSGDRILKRTCHVTVVLAEKE